MHDATEASNCTNEDYIAEIPKLLEIVEVPKKESGEKHLEKDSSDTPEVAIESME